MKKALFLFFALTLSINAFAVEKTATPASVEKLMQLTEVEKMIDGMYVQMDGMFKNMSSQMGVTEADMPIAEKYMQQLSTAMKEEMNWQKMKAPMVKIYADRFTEQEVLALIKFYESKTGRAMTKKMPLVMQDSMKVTQDMMKDLMPKIQEISKKMAEELEANRKATAAK